MTFVLGFADLQPKNSVLFNLSMPVLRRPSTLASLRESIGSCPRFADHTASLCIPITHPSFAAYWLVKGSLVYPSTDLASSTITLLYLHGGGYVIGQPGDFADPLLYIANALEQARPGTKVSVLMLDYSLAPEAPFPMQLEQVAAAYAWLVREQGVREESVVLTGDSAGGSVCLSLLAHLECPLKTVLEQCAGLKRPGQAVLFSPWVDLKNIGYSYRTNEAHDLIAKRHLDRWASLLFARSEFDLNGPEAARYLNFVVDGATAERDWAAILPARVYVSAGSNEVFVSDIDEFVRRARVAGVEVQYDVGEGRAHDWQLADFLEVGKDWRMGKEPGKAAAGVEAVVRFLRKGMPGA